MKFKALADIDPNPTSSYILKLSNYFDNLKFFMGHNYIFLGPFVALLIMYNQSVYFYPWDFFKIILFGFFKILVTFTIYHRYFAHNTFSCSRPIAVLQCIIASTGAQRSPLWWGSKHVRHHKFCENEGDPHSPFLFGFWYSWMGWVLSKKESSIDWDYVHPHLKTWEMVLTDACSGFIPLLELYLWNHYAGLKSSLIVYWATMLSVYITLGFNVFLHHDPEITDQKQANGRYVCRAHDKCPQWINYSIDLLGEMNHQDHHRYPRKALHPSRLIDVPYWFYIYPGEKIGIFYNVNHHGSV